MSILSRLFGRGATEADEPASVRAIAAQLEGVPVARARFLAAFAYILARVAHADMQVTEEEAAEMERTIALHASLPEAEAKLVAGIALAQADELGGTEDYIVVREFRKIADRTERLELLRCTCAVAAADHTISTAESSEIHQVGEELGFTRQEVNALRLEWRDKLAELKR
jgi:uncharacterized tellurite resistance protein B-like protein